MYYCFLIFLFSPLLLQQGQSTITYEIKDGIAVVRFNDPNSKVNSLSDAFMRDAERVFGELRSAPIKGIVLISGKTDCFIAGKRLFVLFVFCIIFLFQGADINMLERCKSVLEAENLARSGHRFFDELENSPIPIVSAIQGSALGGGLELALASHYRIAVNDKKTVLALPEVMLGLLPGGGGTQRLPKLINVPDALQMMLTGKNIRPSKAKKMGLVDVLVDPLGPGLNLPEQRTLEYLEEVAINTAKQLADKKLKIERKRPLFERMFLLVFGCFLI